MRCKQHSGQPVDISPPENRSHDPVCSAENLDRLRIGRYRFILKAESSIRLPRYKGSTFHGGLGHALRQISPTYYRRLFEPDSSAKSSVPKPYVLVSPLDGLHEYALGQQFSCELILFGTAKQCISFCLAAFEYLGTRMGIGRARGNFAYSQPLTLQGGRHPAQRGNTLCHPFFQTARPARFPAHFHGKSKISTSQLKDELLDKAGHIEITESNLRWWNWDRFSGRQKQWMKFGGLMGSITYQGDLAPFMPYQVVGEWVHIGCKTSFGLGKYLLEL